MEKTLKEYDGIAAECRALFAKKALDYGTAWRILRISSLTDQLYIKAKRIRQIETSGVQKVADKIDDEYRGLVNYAFMALIQLKLDGENAPMEMSVQETLLLYDEALKATRDLMIAKNTDYGEVWREMRISSLTDLILMKLLRVKQIEDHQGKTLISEGLEANYRDMANYAIFALIKLTL